MPRSNCCAPLLDDYKAALMEEQPESADISDDWHMKMATEFVAQIDEAIEYNSVLDVGCGHGRAAKLFAGKRYCGLTANNAEWVALQDQGIEGSPGCMEQMPFLCGEFDLVYARHSLEHSFALPVALLEMRRVGRVAAVAVPCPPGWVLEPGHYYTMSRGAWAHLFMQCGWRPEALWSNDSREYRWILHRRDDDDAPVVCRSGWTRCTRLWGGVCDVAREEAQV